MKKGWYVYRAVWVSVLIGSIFVTVFLAKYVLESVGLEQNAILSRARMFDFLREIGISAIGSIVLGLIVAAMIKPGGDRHS